MLDALQAIQDAKAEKQRIVAEQLEATCEDIDAMDLTVRESNTAGGAGGGADGEAKAAESDTHYERMDAEDTDFITQLKKHQFTDATPTRFLAYSFMSDEQIAAMDREYQARGEELPEQSAYIQRFELAVSESCVSFADLNLPIDSELPCVRPANFAPLSSSNATAATAAAGVRSRYSRPLGTETGSVVDGTAAGAAASWPDSMKRLGVFDVSPVNLAVHQASTRCTPIEVSLEVSKLLSVLHSIFVVFAFLCCCRNLTIMPVAPPTLRRLCTMSPCRCGALWQPCRSSTSSARLSWPTSHRGT